MFKKIIVPLCLVGITACSNLQNSRNPSNFQNETYPVDLPRQVPDSFGSDFFADFKRGDDKSVVKKIIKKVVASQENEKITYDMSFKEFMQFLIKKHSKMIIAEKLMSGKGKVKDKGETFKLLVMLSWMRENPLELFRQLRESPDLNREKLNFVAAQIPNIDFYYTGRDADRLPSLKKAKFNGRTVMVVHNEDVREALSEATFGDKKDKVFSVALYNPKMDMSVGSEYMLSTEFGFTRDEKIMMKSIMPKSDMGRIREMASEATRRAIHESNVKGRIEVVNAIARRVPAELTRSYFGYDADLRSIYRWSRATQKSFFHNPQNAKAHERRAKRAGKEMRAAIRKMIRNHLSGEKLIAKNTIFHSLINLPIPKSFRETVANKSYDDVTKNLIETSCQKNTYGNVDAATCAWYERVVANMIGTLVGGIETTQAAITQSIDFFLDNPSIMNAVVQAAKQGNHERVGQFVWEALRFRPVNPIVMRYVQKDFTFKSGRKVKEGDIAMLSTLSAMHDPDKVTSPDKFIVGRGSVNGGPRGETRNNAYYFHLGNGSHKCLGDYVAAALVPQVVMEIMKLPNLQRVPHTVFPDPKVRIGYIGHHDNIGALERDEDSDKSTFPESLLLQTSQGQSADVAFADPRFLFEDFLIDFDKNEFRLCLSDIKEKAHKVKDYDYLLYEAYYNRRNAGAAFDLAYCRFSKEFRGCIQEDIESLFKVGKKYVTNYKKCQEHLTPREDYFYRTEILHILPRNFFSDPQFDEFGRTPLELASIPSSHDIESRGAEHTHYPWEEVMKFYDRTNHRQSFMNPLALKAYPTSNKNGGNYLNFFTRVDLKWRLCGSLRMGKLVKAAVKKLDMGRDRNRTSFARNKVVTGPELQKIKNEARLKAYIECSDEVYHLPDFIDKYMREIVAGS